MTRAGRLRSSQDVQRVLRRGRRRRGSYCTVHVLAGTSASCRLAVVASKRVGNAVARNRAKRLLRESGRGLRLDTPFDIVLVARAPAATAAFADVQAEVEHLFGRLAGSS